MLKDALGNELKKGDWVLLLSASYPYCICCIYSISKWSIHLAKSAPWNSYTEQFIHKNYSDELIKINSINSSVLIKEYLTICSSSRFKEFISRNKKTYKPLTLIDSPLCGS